MRAAVTDAHDGRVLAVETIVKSYTGTVVLDGVSVIVAPGEIVGLVGHNGAGKSTLMKCISGATRPDSGRVTVNGARVRLGDPMASIGAGLVTVYQELSLLPNLSVVENVFLGVEMKHRGGLLSRAQMADETRALLAEFDLDLDPHQRVGDISVAYRQLLEVAIATRRQAKYLLLDEPTTSLEGGQVERFLDTLRALAQRGLGIVLVDHKLDELYAVCDRIIALVDGNVRIDADVQEVSRDDVVEAIAGDADVARRHEHEPDQVTELPISCEAAEGDFTLRARHVRGPALEDVTISARRGRVLGIYGLVGSGRTEFLRTLVGLEPMHAGTVEIDGGAYRPRSPGHAERYGLVYVTEERKVDGIVPQLDSATNLMLPVLKKHRRLGLLDRRALTKVAAQHMDSMRVHGNRAGPIERLSGGNQQKVILGRALAQQPRILLLDEPTKGVDLGVKAQIHQLVRRLAHDDGLTILLVSSEEDEIVEVADDVVVMSDGTSDGTLLEPEHLSPAALRRIAWNAA